MNVIQCSLQQRFRNDSKQNTIRRARVNEDDDDDDDNMDSLRGVSLETFFSLFKLFHHPNDPSTKFINNMLSSWSSSTSAQSSL